MASLISKKAVLNELLSVELNIDEEFPVLAQPGALYALKNAEEKIKELEEIEAIPVEWLNKLKQWYLDEQDSTLMYHACVFILERWEKENEKVWKEKKQ